MRSLCSGDVRAKMLQPSTTPASSASLIACSCGPVMTPLGERMPIQPPTVRAVSAWSPVIICDGGAAQRRALLRPSQARPPPSSPSP